MKKEQYRKEDDTEFCLEFARSAVYGKVWNCRVKCLRVAADKRNETARTSAGKLENILHDIRNAENLVSLRVMEGRASRYYFAVFRRKLKQGWEFPSRKRRPPPDPVNLLLGAAYTLLTEAVYSAVTLVGLDPYCGFYHTERPGRPALVLDMMEEFRPVIADSVVLTIINNKMLKHSDFRKGYEERPVLLSPDGYKKVLGAFSKRLQTRITVPGSGHRTTYQKLLEIQARRLAATILGKTDRYHPFRTR